jgi:hypothetical protein
MGLCLRIWHVEGKVLRNPMSVGDQLGRQILITSCHSSYGKIIEADGQPWDSKSFRKPAKVTIAIV